MASTQNSTENFQVFKNRLIILSFPALSRLFLPKFSFQNVAFTPWKKASALHYFKMAMKQPALAAFHFKNFSNHQDKSSTSTLGENTDACSRSIPDAHGPPKIMYCFISMKHD